MGIASFETTGRWPTSRPRRMLWSMGWLLGVLGVAGTAPCGAQTVDSLRVMSYNIWVGGTVGGQPLSRTVGVIQAAGADIVGLQEQGSSGLALASALGFHYHNLGGSTAILSRYPIVEPLSQGVKLQLSAEQVAYIFDVHLTPYPYQPYDIRDGLITTEAQAISQAQATRSVTTLLASMVPSLGTGAPVFLVGDFNEPSHLDWTQEAADAGKHFGMKVDWPTSRSVTNAGMVDAFRELRPDEVLDPGFTWTPGYPAPNVEGNEVHDRIDFVYYTGMQVTPTSAQTLGYNGADGSTDIAIQPYPSDHRAVVVEFDVPACMAAGDLTGDCTLDVSDWIQFRSGQHVDMTGFTRSQAMSMGDLNGDYQNNHADFVLFKGYYETANGVGSFAAMLAVPEPGGALMSIWVASAMIVGNGRRRRAAVLPW